MAEEDFEGKEKEDIESEMEVGDLEADVYSDEGRDDLEENDELDAWEEGFMEGAEGAGQQGKCANCGKALLDDSTVEKEVDGELRWFCSDTCLDEYEQKHR